jgi:hypothetical protein
MKDLLWDLFLMVRELMPPTEATTRRQQEWAARFHSLDVEGVHQAVDTADHDEDDEPDEKQDPHEHGVPHRPKVKVKHRR